MKKYRKMSLQELFTSSIGLSLFEKKYLSEAVNRHSTHIEDLTFTNLQKGVAQSLSGLVYIKNKLGSTTAKSILTIKIDGSPAIVSGYIDGKFFVGSKSLFNKEPKINFSLEDIDNNHTGGIVDKMKEAFIYLREVIPQGKIYQGDFLFDKEILQKETIDGILHYTWQPNTIKYAVEADSETGREIAKAKIGFVFHTEYTSDGYDPKTIKLLKFGISNKNLIHSDNVWTTEVYHKNMGDIIALSPEQEYEFDSLVDYIKKTSKEVNWNIHRSICDEAMTFINSYIKTNKPYEEPDKMAENFESYVLNKVKKDIDSKKTEKGKLTAKTKYENNGLLNMDLKNIAKIFSIHFSLTKLKMIILSKLETAKNTKTFLVTNFGDIIPTGEEGYVMTTTGSTGCKIVDRYEFSKANFSPDFKKGWTSDTRQ